MFICLMFFEVWFWMKISSLYNASESLLSKMAHLWLVRLVLSYKLNSKSKASVASFLKSKGPTMTNTLIFLANGSVIKSTAYLWDKTSINLR